MHKAPAPAAQPGAPCRKIQTPAQMGQDLWVLQNLHMRCGRGTFVEFGARNGVEHSNTLYFERTLGWRGILVEADPTQYRNLQTNRPRSWTYHGAVCTRAAGNTTSFAIADPVDGGWSGMHHDGAAAQTHDDPRGRRPVPLFAGFCSSATA